MDLYGAAHPYQQGACGYAGGTEYVACGLSMSQAYGGPMWRGFCLCGWRSHWRMTKQVATDELTAHAGYKGWGALAYDKSRTQGFVVGGQVSLEAAKREALIGCNTYDAQVLTWGYISYIALAKSRNGRIGCASQPDRKLAEKYALDVCRTQERDSKITLVFHTVSGVLYKLERPFG